MKFYKVLKLIFVQVIALQLTVIESAPTFGDEFVHIKVHLPKETGGGHTVSHRAYEHSPPVVRSPPPSKVIHHFHQRRRRPHKKAGGLGKHSGLLESIILSEVKKPLSADHYKYLRHAEDIAKHVDTFIVKEEKPKKHVETYTLIEEKAPKETVETYKVIQSKPEAVPSTSHIDDSTAEVSDEHGGSEGGGYHYPKAKGHGGGGAYKAIDAVFDDFHSHFSNSDEQYHQPSPHYGPAPKRPSKVSYSYRDDDADNDDALSHGYHYKNKGHHFSNDYSGAFSKQHLPVKSTPSHFKRPAHRPSSYKYSAPPKSHGYHYEPSNSDSDDFNSGYDYKPGPPVDHIESTYHPPKHQSSGYNYKQNTLFDEDSHSPYDSSSNNVSPSVADSYLPPDLSNSFLPPPPSAITDSSTGADAQWPNYKATETYTGIDSYSAAHVQGVGSGGYHYPSNYS